MHVHKQKRAAVNNYEQPNSIKLHASYRSLKCITYCLEQMSKSCHSVYNYTFHGTVLQTTERNTHELISYY